MMEVIIKYTQLLLYDMFTIFQEANVYGLLFIHEFIVIYGHCIGN